jgi:DhnA family fructose-bisphosphate aldolase class Ia
VVNLTQALRNITVEGGTGSIYTRNVFVDNQIAMKIRESVLKIIADNADNTEVKDG